MNTPTFSPQAPPPCPKDVALEAHCKRAIAFDIETIANKAVLAIPGIIPKFTAGGNVKDPIKIAAKIKEKEEKWISEVGLNPNYGQIVVIVLKNSTIEHVFQGDDEKFIVESAWKVLEHWEELVTFNGKAFDLPYLIRRSWYLGVPPTISYDLFPFRSVNHYDLRLLLNHGNKTAKGKLSDYAKLKLGIDIFGEGSEVQEMYDNGKIDDIARHCLDDTTVTWELFKSMGKYYL